MESLGWFKSPKYYISLVEQNIINHYEYLLIISILNYRDIHRKKQHEWIWIDEEKLLKLNLFKRRKLYECKKSLTEKGLLEHKMTYFGRRRCTNYRLKFRV